MAGHSKWANIKRRKGAQDAKRGKIFTKLIRELATAARIGGPDPEANARLRLALVGARQANMPKDTIQRAVQRGAGGGEDTAYDEVRYEGYGPGGVAVLVEGLTDNRNRTVSEVRHVFAKFGGNLGERGCVAHLFEKKGLLEFEQADEDSLMEAALDAGAEDLRRGGEALTVVTDPAGFDEVARALSAGGFKAARIEMAMLASTTISLSGADAEKMLQLIDALEELDDVQAVHANIDMALPAA